MYITGIWYYNFKHEVRYLIFASARANSPAIREARLTRRVGIDVRHFGPDRTMVTMVTMGGGMTFSQVVWLIGC